MLPGFYAISWKDLLTGDFQEPMLADYLRRGDSCVFQVHELNAKCEHGRPVARASIVCCYPTAGALEKDHNFVSLTNTVKAKLASIHVPTCKQECCSMRPLDFLPAANAQRLEHEVAQLRLGKQGHFEAAAELGIMYRVKVPVVPVSSLPYWQFFQDRKGQNFGFPPSAGSKPRSEHIEQGTDLDRTSKRSRKVPRLRPPDFHAAFWIMAWLQERLRHLYEERFGKKPQGGNNARCVNYRSFAREYAMTFGQPAHKYLEALTDDRRSVSNVHGLIFSLQQYMKYMAGKNLSMGQSAFQFPDLRLEESDVVRLSVEVAHLAWHLLPRTPLRLLS